MKTNKQLLEERSSLRQSADRLAASQDSSWNRNLDVGYCSIMRSIEEIDSKLATRDKIQGGRVMADDPMERPGQPRSSNNQARSENGVVFLRRDQLAADAFSSPVANGLGEFVRAMMLGPNAHGIAPEVSAALSGGSGTAGGYTVPTELAAGVLDMARAKSVLARAGASTAIMTSSEMTMAKLTSDPTMQVKIENAEFDESDLTFGALKFYPLLIGTVVTMSRELAEDSVGFAATVEETLSRALAVQLDKMPIQGAPSGGATRIGLIDDADIGEDASIGTLAWSDITSAATTIRGNDHEPNAVIIHPTRRDPLLNTTASGSGEYLGLPPSLANVAMLDTTNITTTDVLVGDFTKLLWALRSGPLIESTTVAGNTFKKHQLQIKITWRGDYGVLYANAFRRLTGIS